MICSITNITLYSTHLDAKTHMMLITLKYPTLVRYFYVCLYVGVSKGFYDGAIRVFKNLKNSKKNKKQKSIKKQIKRAKTSNKMIKRAKPSNKKDKKNKKTDKKIKDKRKIKKIKQ